MELQESEGLMKSIASGLLKQKRGTHGVGTTAAAAQKG